MTEYQWLTSNNPFDMANYMTESHYLSSHWFWVYIANSLDKPVDYKANLIREIIGNPFRPVKTRCKVSYNTFEVIEYKPWLTNRVKSFAKGILESECYDDVPILADFLEEAGCDNEELLRHFRQEVKCPECMGRGLIEPGNDYPFYPYKCDCCGGSGWLPKPIPCQSCCWGLRLVGDSKI